MLDTSENKDFGINEEKYKDIISSMGQGFALHEIILNDEGKPVDYKFLEVNDSFEKIIGKGRDEIIGRTVKEIFPNVEDYWIDNYGEVALSGKPKAFEHFSKDLNRYFKINANSPHSGQFAVIITDVTDYKDIESSLSEKTKETRKLNSFMMGREAKMVELKKEIEDLKLKLEDAPHKDN